MKDTCSVGFARHMKERRRDDLLLYGLVCVIIHCHTVDCAVARLHIKVIAITSSRGDKNWGNTSHQQTAAIINE